MTTVTFIDHVSDPMLAVDGRTVREANEPAQVLFGVDEATAEGGRLADLFPQAPALADRYGSVLEHYRDVGGVVVDDARHFDRDHDTIAALLADTDPTEADSDVGIYREGRLEYYHVTTSSLADAPVAADRLVTFRDVTELKRRERDLDFLMQVVSRVLRHNLRNDLTVARGYAATIEERTEEPVASMADQIRDTCADLVDTSEKARYIQQAIDADGRVPFDLDRVVGDSVEEVAEEYPDASIDVDVPALSVLANPKFPKALSDTVENAVVYTDPPVDVEIRARRDGQQVELLVVDNGPGIPQTELDALARRGETDLVHGSGAGLWLTYTVVEESDGDVTYDTGPDGTTVRMRLPAAEND